MDNKLLHQLNSGEIKQRDLEKYVDQETARQIRREFIAAQLNISLETLNNIGFDAAQVQNKNIENLIGSIELPLGVAGPVKVVSNAGNGEFYLPLATTEGALVASISRGCKVINESGGAMAILTKPGVSRAPVFEVKALQQIIEFESWLEKNFGNLRKIAAAANDHLSLKKVKTVTMGRNIWLRLSFDTDEAMGMNMSTKASRAVCEYIVNEFADIELLALSGNLCSDKKMAQINATEGRGRSVTVEVELNSKLIEESLHTTATKLLHVNQVKNWEGSALAGANTFNAHAANIVAAVFAATGQDLAHTTDTSLVYTTMQETKNGVLVSVTVPAILIGFIGGGTCLPKQAAAKELMLADVNRKAEFKNKSDMMAVILATGILAGEISLLGALAADELVKAHEALGRGKK